MNYGLAMMELNNDDDDDNNNRRNVLISVPSNNYKTSMTVTFGRRWQDLGTDTAECTL